MRILSSFLVLSALIHPALAQTGPNPDFSLSSDDLVACQLFLYKHAGDKPSGWLRIQLTPEKSAEFSAIVAKNPQGEVGLTINGKPFSRIGGAPPKIGSFLDLKIASPDDAFATAETWISPPTTPTPVFVPAPDEPVFSLVPDDVSKIVISLFRDHTGLEVTFVKKKQKEFAKTAAENLQKKGEIILNGRPVGELTITKPTLGHSVKVTMPSSSKAFAMAKDLIDPIPKTEIKTP